jgi:hypothetical protein
MSTSVKYIVDEKGKKIAVLIPIKHWTKINEDYNKLQKKVEILTGIKDALMEVKSISNSGKKLQTLKSFL